MSYEVIARRWRPRDLNGLVGQEHVRQTLVNALRHDRLHHALLLTGPRGTGKTSTARILAKSLRCPNAVDLVPCNQCSECEEINAGRSVNVIEIDGASNNGVDAIRELRDTVGYLPSSGKYKMYIIDEVHMLSTSAFNALLKTLEEPPGHVYFVMATTEVQKIPNTILSRVQRFDFRRIPTRVIAAHLQTICETDGVAFEPEALWIIARQGDGSMRDAQSLLDQVINFTGGQLKRDLVVGTLGLTDRGLLNDAIGAVFRGRVDETLVALGRLHQSGGDPKLFLLDYLEQVRNSLLIKLDPKNAMVDLPDSEREVLRVLGLERSPEDLHLFFDMGLKGAQDLTRASDPLLVLEMVFLRMSSAPRLDGLGVIAPGTPVGAAGFGAAPGAGVGASGGAASGAGVEASGGSAPGAGVEARAGGPPGARSGGQDSFAAESAGGPLSRGISGPEVNSIVRTTPAPDRTRSGPDRIDSELGTASIVRTNSSPGPRARSGPEVDPLVRTSESSGISTASRAASVGAPAPAPAPASGPAHRAASVGAPAPTPASTPAPAPAPASGPEHRFKELVEKIKEVNGLVGAQLENCFLVKLEGTTLELGISVKHKFLFDKMNGAEFKKKVVNYVNSFWGPGHALNLVLTEPGVDVISPKALNEKLREENQRSVREAVEKHPLVQSAQSVFKTEIKSIKEIKS